MTMNKMLNSSAPVTARVRPIMILHGEKAVRQPSQRCKQSRNTLTHLWKMTENSKVATPMI